MAYINRFIINTDYATIKNDAEGTLSVTVPGSTVIASGGQYTNTTSLTIGEGVSTIRSQGNSTRDASTWIAANQLALPRTGVVSGASQPYTLAAAISRTSTTTIELFVGIYNPYGANLTTQAGDETITFDVTTFLPPFV